MADAESLDCPGPKVLNENIGIGSELLHDGQAFGCGHVYRDALLATVAVQLESVHAILGVQRVLAQDVASRKLDLDHLGSLLGEQHCAHRPGDYLGQVDDLYSCERSSHVASVAQVCVVMKTRCSVVSGNA